MNVRLLATVAGDCSATKWLLSASASLKSPCALIVKSPVTVTFPKLPVVAVIVAPETCVLNTPDTKLTVVPVVVVPVKELNVPVVAATVVPVKVCPLTVPVTLIPELKNPEPSVEVLPEKIKFPE